MSSILNLIIIPLNYWFFPSKWQIILNFTNKKILIEIKSILTIKFNYINRILFISIFLIILINNIIGLYPYIFTRSRHIIFSIRISISIWLGLILYGWINNTNFIFSHIIPQGTPILLIPFMVLIETIRNIIRPITLTIRLTANIIAGHLLLTLLSQRANSIYILISSIIIIIQLILLILEFRVSIIQSYVFIILRTLYSKEIN